MRERAGRDVWSSRLGFVLACIGSAVGIGNLWRFPYVVGSHGGGAFLVPYVVAVILCGVPLMVLEFTLGRHHRSTIVPVLAATRKGFGWLGVVLVAVVTLVLSYYLVVTGWVLAFLVAFAAGAPPGFAEFTRSWRPLAAYLAAGAICFVVVQAGIRRGIERLSIVLMPLLMLLVVLLAGAAMSLPGASRGLAYYLAPDFARLAEPAVWVAAFGQAFFSLGVGAGIMLTYGSYAGAGSVVLSAGLVAAADLLVAVVAGLVVFPVVFSSGLDPAVGVQLAFVTLPRVFEQMAFGLVFGTAFFFLLAVAALTSAVSMLEVPVATLIEVAGLSRRRATSVATAVVLVLGLPSALSYAGTTLEVRGRPLLDVVDFAFGTVGMIVAGLVLSLAAGWFVPARVLTGALPDARLVRWSFLLTIRVLVPLALAGSVAATLLAAPAGRAGAWG